MSECIFCRILDGQLPASFVYRDDRCAAFMDIQPVNLGHLLVVPVRHAAYGEAAMQEVFMCTYTSFHAFAAMGSD